MQRRSVLVAAIVAAIYLAIASSEAQPAFDVSSEVVYDAEFGVYEYRYFVTNLTDAPVIGIVVSDVYPEGCVVDGWKVSVGIFDPVSRVWTIPVLPTAPVGRLTLDVAAVAGTLCPIRTPPTTTTATTTPTTTTATTAPTTTTSIPATTTTIPATTTTVVRTTVVSSTTTIAPPPPTTVPPSPPPYCPCEPEGALDEIGLGGALLLLGGTGLIGLSKAVPHLQRAWPLVPLFPFRNPFGTTVSPIRGLRAVPAPVPPVAPPRHPPVAALPLGGPMSTVETITPDLPARKEGGRCCSPCCCCPPNDPHAAALAVLGHDNSPLRLHGFTVTTTTTTRYGFAAPGSAAASRVVGVAQQVAETVDEEVEAEVASGLTDKLKEAAEQSPALLALLRGDLDQAAEIGGLLGGDLGASLAAMLVEVVEERKARADAASEAAAEPAPEVGSEVTGPAPPTPPTPPPQSPPAPPPGSGLGI